MIPSFRAERSEVEESHDKTLKIVPRDPPASLKMTTVQ